MHNIHFVLSDFFVYILLLSKTNLDSSKYFNVVSISFLPCRLLKLPEENEKKKIEEKISSAFTENKCDRK